MQKIVNILPLQEEKIMIGMLERSPIMKQGRFQIPLNFLSDGNYTAEIYTDANDVNENPNHLNKQTKQLPIKM